MSDLDNIIIRMYIEGYSIRAITDYVFSYSKRNCPNNNQFKNYIVSNNKRYNRLDCYSYASKVILAYNNRLRSIL